ncbi:MAG: hypothetical protein JEY99_21785 [Spirochaetales bacterium]|nr:hypothetical protein [Spirochaetales bacterium]
MKRVKIFLELFRDNSENSGSLLLTSVGNLKPDFCGKYYEAVTGEDFRESWIRNEDDYQSIQIIKIILKGCGYLHALKIRIKLTDKAFAFLDAEKHSDAYMEFLTYYLDKFNWDYLNLRFDEDAFRIIQDSALFSLYILKKKGNGMESENDIIRYFIEAFFKDLFISEDDWGERLVKIMFESLFMVHFCSQFGLIDKEYLPEIFFDRDKKIYKVKTTGLYKKNIQVESLNIERSNFKHAE